MCEIFISDFYTISFSDLNDYTSVKPKSLIYLDCFGSETNVKALLNPTIFTNYGLTYRDFYIVIIMINNRILFLCIIIV